MLYSTCCLSWSLWTTERHNHTIAQSVLFNRFPLIALVCIHTSCISATKWIAATSIFPELIFLSLMSNNPCGLRTVCGLCLYALDNGFYYNSVMFTCTMVSKMLDFLFRDKIRLTRCLPCMRRDCKSNTGA